MISRFFYMIGSSPVDGTTPIFAMLEWSNFSIIYAWDYRIKVVTFQNDCENWSGPSAGLDPVAIGRPDNKQNRCRTEEELRSST